MIDCSKVYVTTSSLSTKDNIFNGAYARKDIMKDEIVEKGLMSRLNSDNFDGMNNPHVFTWSDSIPNRTWAFASGCATFYNTNLPENANVKMVRYFEEDRFEIVALRDIKKDEELTHTYKSLKWRTVFVPLYEKLIS